MATLKPENDRYENSYLYSTVCATCGAKTVKYRKVLGPATYGDTIKICVNVGNCGLALDAKRIGGWEREDRITEAKPPRPKGKQV